MPLAQEKYAQVIDALNGPLERNGRWDFWECFDRLRLDGRPWNHKRVCRMSCELVGGLVRPAAVDTHGQRPIDDGWLFHYNRYGQPDSLVGVPLMQLIPD